MGFSEWEYAKVDDVASVTKLAGYEFTKYIEYVEDGEIIAIRALNVQDGILDLSNIKRIRATVSNSLLRSKLYKDEILLTYTGSKYGQVAIIDKDNKYHLAPNVAKITINQNHDPYFFFCYFRSNIFKHYLKNYGVGSSQPTIPMKFIRQLEVPVPPKEEQEKISKIFKSIDKKIQINNQINKTLETMAQMIFKQWFIDFEFPNKDGEPYKSSGGEMVESELGMIPKGWQAVSLYDLANYINGTSFKKGEINEQEGLPIIKIAELKQGYTDSTKYFKGIKQDKYYLKDGDILFSWSGNPKTSIDTFIWYRGDGILNQHIFKVEPYSYSKEFIYLILKYLKPIFMQTASNKQTTGLGHVTISDLKRLKIFLPNEQLVDNFTKKIKPMIRKIHINDIENNKLNHLRDILLPKFMSGEIRIPIESDKDI
jgi:type I restriction enzyme S subunit